MPFARHLPIAAGQGQRAANIALSRNKLVSRYLSYQLVDKLDSRIAELESVKADMVSMHVGVEQTINVLIREVRQQRGHIAMNASPDDYTLQWQERVVAADHYPIAFKERDKSYNVDKSELHMHEQRFSTMDAAKKYAEESIKPLAESNDHGMQFTERVQILHNGGVKAFAVRTLVRIYGPPGQAVSQVWIDVPDALNIKAPNREKE